MEAGEKNEMCRGYAVIFRLLFRQYMPNAERKPV